jgi:hypothetical protein
MTMTRSLAVGTTQAREYGEAVGAMRVSYGSPQGRLPTVEVESCFRGLDTGDAGMVAPGAVAHSQIQIGSLLDHRLRMVGPVTLELEQEDEFYVARCDNLDEYGYGFDPISAVQDIRKTIAELYWQLKDDQDRLGPDLARTWQRLTELVYEV